MEAKEYRISEIAEILGVSADTLRLYEKQGLLHPGSGKMVTAIIQRRT